MYLSIILADEGTFMILAENSAFSTQATKVVSIGSRFECFFDCLTDEACEIITISENECYIYDELLVINIVPEFGKSIWKRNIIEV